MAVESTVVELVHIVKTCVASDLAKERLAGGDGEVGVGTGV